MASHALSLKALSARSPLLSPSHRLMTVRDLVTTLLAGHSLTDCNILDEETSLEFYAADQDDNVLFHFTVWSSDDTPDWSQQPHAS